MIAFDLMKALRSIKPRRRLPLPVGIEIHGWTVAAILRPQFVKHFGAILP